MSKKKIISKDLKKTGIEVEKLKKKAEENLEGWKRAKADYINFKKRMEIKQKELIKFSNESLLLEMLPVLDNLEKALKFVPKELSGSNWIEGIKYIDNQLKNLLKSKGIEPIEALHNKFDPVFHEAIEEVIIKDKKQKGVVLEEVVKGYKMHGKVIRPSKVKVGV